MRKINTRIIPRLDIKGSNLVKGINFEGLRILGKPENFARYYYEQGADELLYMDIVASLYGRNSLLDIISKTSKEIFIPLTVGGGLRTIEDINHALNAGADKVALNTAAINDPGLIRNASRRFGSSTIVVSIEAKKLNNNYEAYTDNGREKTGFEAIAWACEAVKLGAGEVMITSIDNEGTGKGFDLSLTNAISESVSVPVIACGGAGKKEHIYEVLAKANSEAVSIASILHYDFHNKKDKRGSMQHINPLIMQRGFSKINSIDLFSLKKYLFNQKIFSRNFLNTEKIEL